MKEMAIESESDNSETITSNVVILKRLQEKGIHYKQIIGLHTFEILEDIIKKSSFFIV